MTVSTFSCHLRHTSEKPRGEPELEPIGHAHPLWFNLDIWKQAKFDPGRNPIHIWQGKWLRQKPRFKILTFLLYDVVKLASLLTLRVPADSNHYLERSDHQRMLFSARKRPNCVIWGCLLPGVLPYLMLLLFRKDLDFAITLGRNYRCHCTYELPGTDDRHVCQTACRRKRNHRWRGKRRALIGRDWFEIW
jgi:hypothetical protein